MGIPAPGNSPYAPLPSAPGPVSPAPWLHPRGVGVACAAAALVLLGSVLPPPWPGLWAFMVGIGALAVARREVGGGLAGAVAGTLFSVVTLAPAVLPTLVEIGFRPHLRGGDGPVISGQALLEEVSAAVARAWWAALAATILVPALGAVVVAGAPPGAGAISRPSRALPFLLLLFLVPYALAEGFAIAALGESVIRAASRVDTAAGPVGATAAMAALGLFRLGTLLAAVVGCVRAIRRRSDAPMSRLASICGLGLLLAATAGPSGSVGLALSVSVVAALPGWTNGGAVTGAEIAALHPLGPRAMAGLVVLGTVFAGLAHGLGRVGTWARRQLGVTTAPGP